MPDLSFAGASNFTISGGNFNDVAGNVTTFNFTGGLGQVAGNQDALAHLVDAGNSTGNQLPRGERKSLPPQNRGHLTGTPHGAQIQNVPSTPSSSRSPRIVTSTNSTTIASSPTPSPTYSQESDSEDSTPSSSRSPRIATPTNSTTIAGGPTPSPTYSQESDSEGYVTPASHSSRHSTPPTDIEEHRDAGTSGVPSPGQRSDTELLTPLTNSLGLQTLPAISNTPLRSPMQSLSPVPESPEEFGLQAPRVSSHSPVAYHPPSVQASPMPRVQSEYTQPQAQRETLNPRGPPPPVPPRPQVYSPTSTSTTPFPTTRASSVAPSLSSSTPQSQVAFSPGHDSPIGVPVNSPSAAHQGLEDSAAIFARLQAERPTTKGYASGLSPSVRTRTLPHTPPPPPPFSYSAAIFARLQAERPTTKGYASGLSPSVRIRTLPHTPPPPPPFSSVHSPRQPHSPSVSVASPQTSHWTTNTMTGWAGDVDRQEGSSAMSSWDSKSAQPSTTPPQARSPQYEAHHQYSQPPPIHHSHQNSVPYPHHHDNVRQHSYNMLWGNGSHVPPPHPAQQPGGFNNAPHANPFVLHPSAPAPPFVPPFGAPASFNAPGFGGHGFGGPVFGGFPFQR
ncbi:hypothetical protein AN958_04016 [Leucoagaricus sp. SymC.cos]|nr:hypothetical protein AN958_04016 [Leucoagaricus sp. SymC.cos]